LSLLSLSAFSVALRGRQVLRDVALSIDEGELVGLIGPNGAGKTTLMRAALGLIPFTGESSLATLSQAERARRVAWMPQAREIAWPVSVEDVVMLGRMPHMRTGTPGVADRQQADAAIARMELEPMRHRAATRLSGGEQARVLIARALAQDTPLLMADEPVAGLDPAHQIATMATFADLALGGKSVLVSLHDLGLAARHCTRIVMLGHGGLVADGPPADVLTPDRLADVFGIRAHLSHGADGLVFQPLSVIP
jgi:iron complex transport system ATP-binding protein